MEKKSSKINPLNRNVFNKITFTKSTKINYSYRDVVNRLEKFSNKFSQFINFIENSIENDMNITGRGSQKNIRSFLNFKKGTNTTVNTNQRYNTNRSLGINTNYKKKKKGISLEIPKKKKILKNIFEMKGAKSTILEDRKGNKLNKYHQNYYPPKRKGRPNHLSNSAIENNKKKYIDNSQAKYLSVSNSDIIPSKHGLNSYNFTNNYFFNKNKKNTRIIRPQSAESTNSINEYNYRTNRSKYKSTNCSKNLSVSLYRTNKNYFSNYRDILQPDRLTKFVNKSQKIQSSYKNDLEANLSNKEKKWLKIAKDEINMKDPDYHHRQIFKNVLQVKKTLRAVRKMRAEKKTKVKYYGPGNINNESIIRSKNANLIRFCDSICHMKDDKFYDYRKFLNDFYPTLTKNVFKEKYQIPEKNDFYEKKCNENQIKINRLFAAIHKQ